MGKISTDDLIAKLPDLDLNKIIDAEIDAAEIDAFLTAGISSNSTKPFEKLESVACVTSPRQSRAKLRRGWSASSGCWYGGKVLRGEEMTSLVRGLADETSYTLKADTYLDAPERPVYGPGRFQACHAECS